ncbi:MAG TPA: ABC transporter permease [Candidatus Bathyarchaeia archaeon]|nr:ABC transporter permease [Candidatus Bathyarchaeia archaeon]
MNALLRRVAWSLAVIAGAACIAFAIVFLIPADPARTLAGPKADPETVAAIRRDLGLDRPLAAQLAAYAGRLVRGDLGRSYLTHRPVVNEVLDRLPATVLLGSVSLALSLLLGAATAALTAPRKGSKADLAVLGASLVVLSMPVFWLGEILLDVFGYRLRILPLGGYGGLDHLALPALTLALPGAAFYSRLLHESLADELGADYVRTARAKGISGWRLYLRHALPNAAGPLLSVVGLDLAGLLGGVVLTETVFDWPGIGRLAVEAVFNQDVPMVMATTILGSALVVAASLLVDLVRRWLDPRLTSL